MVVLSGGAGTAEMDDFMTSAGLLPVTSETDATGRTLYNRAQFDAIGLNVVSPFVAYAASCTFQTTATPGPETSFVVMDAPSPSPGDPVVVHRVIPP